MKKLLALALTLASLGFAAPSAEAKTNGSSSSPTTIISSNGAGLQFEREDRFGRQDRWERRNSHRSRIRVYTRYVRFGRMVFRETYLVRFLPYGGVRSRLISRERVR
jgi:hypothetical protein